MSGRCITHIIYGVFEWALCISYVLYMSEAHTLCMSDSYTLLALYMIEEHMGEYTSGRGIIYIT